MENGVFFHQYRRPRYNNPTFISNNVNTSLTFFNPRSEPQPHMNIDAYSNQRNSSMIDNNHLTYENRQYSNPIVVSDAPYRSPSNSISFELSCVDSNTRQRSSNLSAYGSNSLSLNQKDIYNKQNSNFNIITMKPKEYDTSIKQHPTLTVENKDEMYYKRMTEEIRKKQAYEQQNENKKLSEQNPIQPYKESIAGKHTYSNDKNINKTSTNQELYEQRYLNNTNINNDTLPTTNPNKHFTPKLLNHMDELLSLS